MSAKRKDIASVSDELRYTKRPRPSYEDEDFDDEPSTTSSYTEKPRNDPVYGQKNAFPGLDGPGSDAILYGPPEDGIEYLRMVRSEANTLPHFFIAPKVPENDGADTAATNGTNGVNEPPEQDGFYIDGVYIAASTTNDNIPPTHPANGSDSGPDPQESYYTLLQHRFLLLRSTLKCTPPASAITSLDTNHPITFPTNSRKARTEWRRLLQAADPHMAQLACMDIESVLALTSVVTRLLSEVVRGGDVRKVKRLGAWAWGLLGRCRDISELGSSEVGEIRELGKRAAKVLVKMRESQREIEMEVSQLQEQQEEEPVEEEEQQSEGEEGDAELTSHAEGEKSEGPTEAIMVSEEVSVQVESTHTNGDSAPEDLEAAKARLQAELSTNISAPVTAPSISTDEGEVVEEEAEEEIVDGPTETRKQSRAMLDMIITIVGEFYGQRDLLESRDLWDEDLEEWS
ncbi:hypothetical protein FQN54_003563 [Arachnomyces sp. PD_36]|nr:hypothetical protein FQN54_003563 [Arachnomyces sp. PD_36]